MLNSVVKMVVQGSYKYSGIMQLQEKATHILRGSPIAILNFHRVTDDLPEDDLTVSTTRFEALCHMLAKRFRIVPLAEVFRAVRSGRPFPSRTVALTFDDGYRDNLLAARTLARHHLPACFFITTSFIDSSKEFDWDRGAAHIPKLTWDEVREMDRMGFEIGSHTHTHPDLGAVSLEEARYELAESKRVLEIHLRHRVSWFAFPFGRAECFPRARWPLVREAGYEGCVSVFNEFVCAGADPQMLPRFGVPVCSPLALEVQLSGCMNWLYRLRDRFRGRTAAPLRRPGIAVPDCGLAGSRAP
jgi:peptidoglycan/xylan/chitin deacetylase (PgdA/CDA1 family)